ncbi:hypothetical protein CKO25_05700 [Thiocapsa imhoffii]|uniref:DUF2325 domain-containing protein n=1 Tax=Thiocapsa imhoffii TaxID=382777 RepID=A0A9X0WH20_9GAMM|nr:DUF2325 domain-containing protein [Thiocapsa imhoffii]MBK1644154.1 hypothetical protein [Thiocapsa imhoffii]
MQRLIFELSDTATECRVYDYETQRLIANLDGDTWTGLFGTLNPSTPSIQHRCCHHDGPTSMPSVPLDDQPPSPPPVTHSPALSSPRLAPLQPRASRSPGSSKPLTTASSTQSNMPHPSSLNAGAACVGASLLRDRGRRKLWDIPHKYHCPIIGTCLSVEELRRLAERHAYPPHAKLSDFDLHISFVAAAETKNPLAIATHKALEKRYASCIRRFSRARDPAGLMPLWEEALATGEAPAALWALMTHPRANLVVLTRAYEDIHMLSHQIGAGQRADLKRLTETRGRLERLQADFDDLFERTQRRTEEREAHIRNLEHALGERERDCADLRVRETRLRDALEQGQTQRLQARIEALDTDLKRLRGELERTRAERDALQVQCTETRDEANAAVALHQTAEAERRALERMLETLLAEDQCPGCPASGCRHDQDLGGRRVLCVGGRQQLVEQYRAMVASCNGRFEHHDGGLEDNQRRLETMLAAADIVVCATDYVSHGAYHRTKRFCKRHDKPHLLLGRSGLSAFAHALSRISASTPTNQARTLDGPPLDS